MIGERRRGGRREKGEGRSLMKVDFLAFHGKCAGVSCILFYRLKIASEGKQGVEQGRWRIYRGTQPPQAWFTANNAYHQLYSVSHAEFSNSRILNPESNIMIPREKHSFTKPSLAFILSS